MTIPGDFENDNSSDTLFADPCSAGIVPGDGSEDTAMGDCESDTYNDDGTDNHSRTDEAISHLENLALSFLSQLTNSIRREPKKPSESQAVSTTEKRKIVLELANRGKLIADDAVARTRLVQFPRKSKGPSAKTPAQLLRVVGEAHGALISQSPITKRDLFYRDVSLFKGQGTVDTLVDDLAATFSLNRSDLNIRASSKGLYCGSALTIHLYNGSTLVGHDTESSLIPPAQDVAKFEINDDIAWILIVEKDAVFQTLRSAGLTSHPSILGPGLLITGKGYPDLATRQLVKSLSDNMPETTRILILVDADAYGIDIVSVYKYGSISMRHESESLAADRIEWIGVSASEALSLGVARDALLPTTIHDQRKAMSMLRTNLKLPAPWKRELMQMLHIRYKAEIEVLSSLPSTQTFCDSDYKLDKTDEFCNYSGGTSKIRTANPLVGYLVWKINKALHP
ncbi:hypothetical protein M0805_001691 [Coniferiporia weirii]|nr:hypothetical protein M0805_001691 [Coniferiporia weirii]